MKILSWIQNILGFDKKTLEIVETKLNDTIQKQLESRTYENTEEFNLDGYYCWTKVLKVYDGDTLHLAVFVGDDCKRFRCRLAGIDTAEIKSANPLEKEYAIKARERLLQLCGNLLVWTVFHKMDKYGRPLVTLYKNECDNTSFNQILLNENLGYEYDGKKRIAFENWCLKLKEEYHNPVDDNIKDSEILE
jgi:endonuclease YncB( thermonuclease family)